MSRSDPAAGMSIGVVAAQTHVSVAVLRAWEQRYGFPEPDRVPSGHRRYSAEHVEQVRQVVRDRDSGLVPRSGDRPRPRRGAPRRQFDLRGRAPAPSRAPRLRAVAQGDARDQPGDRGRVLRPRRTRGAARQLRTRRVLRTIRGPLERARTHCRAHRSVRGLPAQSRAQAGAGRSGAAKRCAAAA